MKTATLTLFALLTLAAGTAATAQDYPDPSGSANGYYDSASFVVTESGTNCLVDPQYMFYNWDVSANGLLNRSESSDVYVYCPVTVVDYVRLTGWADTGNPYDWSNRHEAETQGWEMGPGCSNAYVDVKVINGSEYATDMYCRAYGSGGVDANNNGYFEWDSTPKVYTSGTEQDETLRIELGDELSTSQAQHVFLYCKLPSNAGTVPTQVIGYQVVFDNC